MGQVSYSAMKRIFFMVALFTTLVVVTEATTKGAIPAPNIPTQCNSIERCCMPTPYTGTPGIRMFKHEPKMPMRVRRPAHLLSQSRISQLERGYKILKELPDSDPRSLLNQMKLHCLYCDNALYYPGQDFPLEIHGGWHFLPWHRMFLYWHERILAKVLDDPTFALPYWAWDNSRDTDPAPNVMPAQYANPDSSLYDSARNNCSFPPFLVDLDTIGGCTTKTPDFIRVQNDRLQYTQLVIGAPTPALFYGLPYFFGDSGGSGAGTFEDQPHGTVHNWLGDRNAQPPRRPTDDMGNFGRAAFDPIFYAHHSNVDRIWCLWNNIPGGVRTAPQHPAFLNSEFTFYDEDANLVKMKVSQVLDTNKLRYKYTRLPTPWMTNGVRAGRENTIPLCNPLSESAVRRLISDTPKHKSENVLLNTPMTFRVNRPSRSKKGTEVLEISGLHIPNITLQVHWKAYLFFPEAQLATGAACPEFVGTFNFIPHVGQATVNPKRVWRVAIGPKLLQLGKDYVKNVVVTFVPAGFPLQAVTFDRARIIYDRSPMVTL